MTKDTKAGPSATDVVVKKFLRDGGVQGSLPDKSFYRAAGTHRSMLCFPSLPFSLIFFSVGSLALVRVARP